MNLPEEAQTPSPVIATQKPPSHNQVWPTKLFSASMLVVKIATCFKVKSLESPQSRSNWGPDKLRMLASLGQNSILVSIFAVLTLETILSPSHFQYKILLLVTHDTNLESPEKPKEVGTPSFSLIFSVCKSFRLAIW